MNEVQVRDSAFPTLTAMMLDDVFVGLAPLDRVDTFLAHLTDCVSLQR